MPKRKEQQKPNKRCHNCGLTCVGMFCCDWCMNTYLARRAAHQVARRSSAGTPPEKNLPRRNDLGGIDKDPERGTGWVGSGSRR